MLLDADEKRMSFGGDDFAALTRLPETDALLERLAPLAKVLEEGRGLKRATGLPIEGGSQVSFESFCQLRDRAWRQHAGSPGQERE